MSQAESMHHEGEGMNHATLWKVLSAIVAVVVAAGIIYILLNNNSDSNKGNPSNTNTESSTSSTNKRNDHDQMNNALPPGASANSALPMATLNHDNNYNNSYDSRGSVGTPYAPGSGNSSSGSNFYATNPSNSGNYPYNTPSGYPPDYYSGTSGRRGLNPSGNINDSNSNYPSSGINPGLNNTNNNFRNNRSNYPSSSGTYPTTSSISPSAPDLGQSSGSSGFSDNRSGNSITSPATPIAPSNPGLNNTIPYNQNNQSMNSGGGQTMINTDLMQIKQLVDQYCSRSYGHFK